MAPKLRINFSLLLSKKSFVVCVSGSLLCRSFGLPVLMNISIDIKNAAKIFLQYCSNFLEIKEYSIRCGTALALSALGVLCSAEGDWLAHLVGYQR